jgi:hypothetical protein
LAIAGTVILYKTCRVLKVKRVGRNHKELVMLGGGTTARAKPTTACTDDLMLLCCFVQARPRRLRLEPPWHSSDVHTDSKSPWRSSRSVRARARLRSNARVIAICVLCYMQSRTRAGAHRSVACIDIRLAPGR